MTLTGMICFTVRIFRGVGTHVGKYLVYLLTVLNVINNSPLLNVIKGNVSRVANDRFPSHCGKGIISFFGASCQEKNELFRTIHVG